MTARPGSPRTDELTYSPQSPPAGAAASSVPDTRSELDGLLASVRAYADANPLVPPLTMAELEDHAARVLADAPELKPFRLFTMVLLHNESWRDAFAAVPFGKRLLLLPPCLRAGEHCPAEFDELGLLCERCGRCEIGPVADTAERLGYAVLVAEGTSTVTALIESGQVQGALGASCMAALERAFPHMAEQPFPSLAMPLSKDGCLDTEVDIDWLREALQATQPDTAALPLDLGAIHREVMTWFDPESLRQTLELGEAVTNTISLDWLAKSGKRWRPFLTTCVFRACADPDTMLADAACRVALAMETIHKASLVYDDMQDHDTVRYGEPTVHEVHGVPQALNVGLDLLGHGYRLIADCGAPPDMVAAMLSLATRGHCTLCVGQGNELAWAHEPEPLEVEGVLEMFRLKTAPSFVVVLGLGAILGGADDATREALASYSEALGVAYQIRDDLNDLSADSDADDVKHGRASLTLTVAYERGNETDRVLIRDAWAHGATADEAGRIRKTVVRLGADAESRRLLDDYRTRALDALRPVTNMRLKVLLHRIAGKLLTAG